MTDEQKKFVEQIAALVREYAPQYGIEVFSPVIGQAILESGWSKSLLAKIYHNYFGLKCGSRWTGKSVNLQTKEEYKAGTKTTIKANFRVYGSMREGVKGYFEFLELPRYSNLKGVTDPETYLKRIKADGYATSSDYAEDVLSVVDRYGLRKYDRQAKKESKVMPVTEKDIVMVGHGSGTPAYHNLYTYTAQRSAKKGANGLPKGVVAVRRLKALKSTERARFGEIIAVTIGRNLYSQDKREYVYSTYSNGRYYSDCSAIGMATLEKMGFRFSWLYNTAAIYQGKEFEDVPVKIDSAGHILNPEILRPVDAILYRGNDASRPKGIGHVEWVVDTPAEDTPADKTATKYPGTFPSLWNGRKDNNGTGYYCKGDGITALTKYPTQIRRIQMLVNWIDDSIPDLTVDGKFGKLTEQKVNVCRRKLGLKANGRFDSLLLQAAKECRK